MDVGHFSRNYLAKTKDFVYFRGGKIEGVDPEGFWIFHPHYAENKETVYGSFQDLEADQALVRLEGSEHWNFEVLSEKGDEMSFAKDVRQVYSNGKIIPIQGIDIASVELLPYGFFKDQNRIYCQPQDSEEWKVLEGADPQSFAFIYNGAEYSRDQDSFYNHCQSIGSLPQKVEAFVGNAENSSPIACNDHGEPGSYFPIDVLIFVMKGKGSILNVEMWKSIVVHAVASTNAGMVQLVKSESHRVWEFDQNDTHLKI